MGRSHVGRLLSRWPWIYTRITGHSIFLWYFESVRSRRTEIIPAIRHRNTSAAHRRLQGFDAASHYRAKESWWHSGSWWIPSFSDDLCQLFENPRILVPRSYEDKIETCSFRGKHELPSFVNTNGKCSADVFAKRRNIRCNTYFEFLTHLK